MRDATLERLLDMLDRERLAPLEVLLLLRVATSEATVVELAAALDREPRSGVRPPVSSVGGCSVNDRRAAGSCSRPCRPARRR
jgi:hypothetical protein